MGRAAWGFLAFAGFTGIAVACSSTPAPPFPDVQSFCAAYAKAACQESTNCHTSPDTCVSEQTQICVNAAPSASADPARQYTQPNAQACINAAQTTYAAATVTFAQLTTLHETCAAVFVGNVPTSGACVSKYDCANYASNNIICDTKTSQCVPQTIVQPGSVGYCSEPGQVCAPGSYCSTTSTPVCTPGGTQGAACSAAVPCGASYRCVGSQCELRSTEGQPCASNNDCDSTAPFCDIYDPPSVCSTNIIFSPGESILCSNYGGNGGVPLGTADAGTIDSGTTPPVDSGAADTGTIAPSDSGGGG